MWVSHGALLNKLRIFGTPTTVPARRSVPYFILWQGIHFEIMYFTCTRKIKCINRQYTVPLHSVHSCFDRFKIHARRFIVGRGLENFVRSFEGMIDKHQYLVNIPSEELFSQRSLRKGEKHRWYDVQYRSASGQWPGMHTYLF